MKKTLIDFTKVQYRQKRYLPKSPKKWARAACYKSDGGEDDDDPDEDEKKELLKKINKIIDKKLEGRAAKEDIADIKGQLSFLTKTKDDKGKEVEAPFPIEELRTMADEKNGVMAKMVDMGVRMQKLETEGRYAGRDMSVRGQVAAWQEKNKDQLVRVMAGTSKDVPEFNLELRAADSPIGVNTVNAGASPYIGRVEVEPGITPILRFPTTFWDFLVKGRTNAPTYVWVNATNPQGAAGWIGPGVAKPPISFQLVADQSVAKKIADSAKVTTELLQDIDGMTTFIEQELRIQVMQKVNATLMDSVATNTVPGGVKQVSQPFSFYANAAGIKTTNPTYVDTIRAAVGALRSGVLTGDITFFINSIDAANMDLSKAVDSGVYLLPPFVTASGMLIAGARIIEDNNVPVGTFQGGFMRYFRILIYKDFSISWGWEMDDFTKNLVTAIGEMRLHQFFNTQFTGAFIRDDFATVQAAITQA